MNARIGEGQLLDSQIINNRYISGIRKSKDKVLNKNGKQLLELCENQNLIVLNGRTVSDKEGEFTFVDHGSSVIDLCCILKESLQFVNDFTIFPEMFSDHLPIFLSLDFEQKESNDFLPLLPKLVFTKADEMFFKNKLKNMTENLMVMPESVQGRVDNNY